jgi:methylthioribose-1-phosphate isomerase
MLVNGDAYTTLWYDSDKHRVSIIDQTKLPHRFEMVTLQTLTDFCDAIRDMQVRGAPLIGATAAYGLALALKEDASLANEQKAAQALLATRPTAVNLQWAIRRIQSVIAKQPTQSRASYAMATAHEIRSNDITTCSAIGDQGVDVLTTLQQRKKSSDKPLNILTHCNAGWLATIDWGTALAPIYKAHHAGLPIHVWVDETRPRNQGASLTAWELKQQGINHTVITDNTGGHLMQHGLVDVCLVGSDRTTASGDVCNKIGTYLKAVAAKDNNVDFYVALPTSTFDWTISDGINEIEIEQRSADEVTYIQGLNADGDLTQVQLIADSPVANYAFDVTPARLVTGLITEYGVYQATQDSLSALKNRVDQSDKYCY